LRTPQIDGITVARLTRTHSPTMPLFIVTAYPDYPALVGALRDMKRSA